MRKPIIALCAALACLGLWPRDGAAQSYPSRPITIVVPLAAGGPIDTMARIIAEPMRAALGQPIIIENVTGAAGTVGTGRVARAAPDGYTLEVGFLGTHVFNGAIYQLGYDVEKDFEPIALLSSNPHVVVTRLSLPASDLKGLIAWLKANQQKVSAGSAGVGSSTHMGAILFGNLIGVRMAIIPYRGAAPAIQDVIAGQTDLMVDVLSNSLPHIQSGKIRPFAITAAARVASAPDIPTVDEAGLPGFHMSTWYALFGPKGMPGDDRHQARECGACSACRSRRAAALCRGRPRHPAAGPADAAGARRPAAGRDREMVSHHQGREHQAGMTNGAAACARESMSLCAKCESPGSLRGSWLSVGRHSRPDAARGAISPSWPTERSTTAGHCRPFPSTRSPSRS